MDTHGFQNVFPIILLVIWVVVKAMAGKKPKAPPPVRESRPQSWTPRPDSPRSPVRPKPGGRLYDSMKEVMQEYFGEAPAPARKEIVDEEEDEAEAFEPEPERPVSRIPARQWKMEETSEDVAAEAYAIKKPVDRESRPSAPTSTASTPVAPLPGQPTTEFFDRPEEITAETAESNLGDIDPRKAIVWSEIIGPPLALRSE